MKNKRKIIDANFPLLSIKTILTKILAEAAELPTEVISSIASTRDLAWKLFVLENEKTMQVQQETKGNKKVMEEN